MPLLALGGPPQLTGPMSMSIRLLSWGPQIVVGVRQPTVASAKSKRTNHVLGISSAHRKSLLLGVYSVVLRAHHDL